MIPPSNTIPLGAHFDGHGVHFSLASTHAQAIDLCLFDTPSSLHESRRVSLQRNSDGLWQVYLPDARPGQLYGYRVHGPYNPQSGQRFNPYKLLVDPYARLLSGDFRWHESVHGFLPGDAQADLSFHPGDSAPYVPRCVVVDCRFDWRDDAPPRTPWSDSIIYECHVKGITALHPDVPEALRGRYLGLATPPVIDHLRRLGVTAVELLPVHHSLTAKHLAANGLVNYWGYDTIGFFAPDTRFAVQPEKAIEEFQTMVRALHRAGIEVILDVVYNHTFEGDHLGPTLCWRGIDNHSYYHLSPHEPRLYQNFTGCGNALNASNPLCRRMILDSLRYWALTMHVDGFRLDLAATLTRSGDGTPGDMSLFDEISADPVLSQVKLIAEPWDVGPEGYRLGHGPANWAEWNDRYRDCVRRFWRGDRGMIAEFATRIAGSSDYFPPPRRRSWCSMNFVTCHDGLTLRDLVSYAHKHNDANGEGNRDGTDQNFSMNCGVEGDTDRKDVRGLRGRLQRSLLATLLLSRGTPMLLAGDELSRTQLGNNNAYGQDNEISWLDWTDDSESARLSDLRESLIPLVHQLTQLRCALGLHDGDFLRGEAVVGVNHKDVVWLRADGMEMANGDWHDDDRRALAMLLHVPGHSHFPRESEPTTAAMWLVAFNAHAETKRFHLPRMGPEGCWVRVCHTAFTRQRSRVLHADSCKMRAHSVVVAQWRTAPRL